MTFEKWCELRFEQCHTLPHTIIYFFWDIAGRKTIGVFMREAWDAALKYGTQPTDTQQAKE